MAITNNASARSATAPRTFAEQFPNTNTRGGNGNGNGSNGTKEDDRKKSEFWINIGKNVQYPLENGETETRLASLALGIPLDSVQEIPENSSNEQYAAFSALRNDLLIQLRELAETLEPGQAISLKMDVELRRKKDDAPLSRSEGRMTFDLLG